MMAAVPGCSAHELNAAVGTCTHLAKSRTNFGDSNVGHVGLCRWSRESYSRSRVQAVKLQPSDGAQDNVSEFVKRMEQSWLISQQPRPIQCKACEAEGRVDCPWCKGTGFFMIADRMLCEVSSRNTLCRVCFGEGTLPCDDCKGTGFRAKWLGDPRPKNKA